MDRRRFLTLLGAGAAALVLPEPPKISYFVGGWAPTDLVNLDGAGWAFDQVITVKTHQYVAYVSREITERQIIGRTTAAGAFIPEVWSEDVLRLVSDKLTLAYLVDQQARLPRLVRGQGDTISFRKPSGLTLAGDAAPLR